MKTILKKRLFFFIFLSAFTIGNAAKFESGEEKIISQPVNDNLWIAGSTITIDAIIRGNLTSAGALISINDTITENLILAGADILVNGYIGDNATLFGENIKILKNVNGDLIVGGAYIQIDKNVTINGDLILLGGYAIINGTVNGDVKCMGGKFSFGGIINGDVDIKADEIDMDGIIKGSASLVANTITLKKDSKFYNNVEYWQKEGEVDFKSNMVNGKAVFNKDLEISEQEIDGKFLGIGMVTFWIIYTLSILLIITLLVLLFSKKIAKAGAFINENHFLSIGYGIAYFVGLLLLTIFLFISVIGIPIGLLTLHLFVFSVLFASSITSVVLAHGINVRYEKNWNKLKLIFVGAIIFLPLRLIFFIPFIGSLIAIIIVSIAFGGLVSLFFKQTKESNNN